MTTDISRVLDAVGAGCRTSREVERLTGIPLRQASSYLSKLSDSGAITRGGRRLGQRFCEYVLPCPGGVTQHAATAIVESLSVVEVISVPALLATPRAEGGSWAWTGTHWARDEDVMLAALCSERAPLELSANGLGRSPTSIAWRASDTGLRLPPEWRDAIRQRRPASTPRVTLEYPYITTVNGSHSDLLAVNALVPRGLDPHFRADVCQDIMLAVAEGDVSIGDLSDPRLVQQFVRACRRRNYESSGRALSLDAPMMDGRSWYDVLAA